jgi:hypothetical protein
MEVCAFATDSLHQKVKRNTSAPVVLAFEPAVCLLFVIPVGTFLIAVFGSIRWYRTAYCTEGLAYSGLDDL